MKKRICTLLLALCLTLGLLPAAAQAAGAGSGTFDTVRWTLDADGGLTVSGTGDLPDGAFAGRTDIVTVTFTGQVARIGRCAFLNARRVNYPGSAKGFPWGAPRGNGERRKPICILPGNLRPPSAAAAI